MLIELMLIVLFVLLCYSLKSFSNDIFAPATVYIAGFFCATLIAYFYKDEWSLYNLSNTTFYTITGGALLFLFICKRFNNNKIIKLDTGFILNNKQNRKLNNRLWILLVISILTYFLKIKYVSALTGINVMSFSDMLMEFNYSNKFSEDKLLIPSWLSNLELLTKCFGYIYAYLISRFIFNKKYCSPQNKRLIIINFLIVFLGTFLSGARGGAIYFITFLVFSINIIWNRNNFWKKSIPYKYIFRVGIVFLIIGISWKSVGKLLGREDSNENTFNSSYVLAVYCGAEIKNLDIFIKNPRLQKHDNSTIVGSATFSSLYQSVGRFINSKKMQNKPDLLFQQNRIYPLGNVYTVYHSYIIDFGYIGLIVLTIISAYLIQLFYNKAKDTSSILFIIAYCFLLNPIAFSFFSSTFFYTLFSFIFLKTIIFTYIGLKFLNLYSNGRS